MHMHVAMEFVVLHIPGTSSALPRGQVMLSCCSSKHRANSCQSAPQSGWTQLHTCRRLAGASLRVSETYRVVGMILPEVSSLLDVLDEGLASDPSL